MNLLNLFLVAGVFFFAVLFDELTSEKLQQFKGHFHINNTGNFITFF